VPGGREVGFRDFLRFFAPRARAYPFTHAHALFEEFRGVLLASPEGPLSLEAYQALGVRQSLYPKDLRPQVYAPEPLPQGPEAPGVRALPEVPGLPP
jgi:hypothetical protein